MTRPVMTFASQGLRYAWDIAPIAEMEDQIRFNSLYLAE
jgi:hypothetical protein